jgi:hypothetical protein
LIRKIGERWSRSRKSAVFIIATRDAQRSSGRPLLRSHNSCLAESLLPHCSFDHPWTMLQTHPECTRRLRRLSAWLAVGFRVQRESAQREGQARGLQEPVGRDLGEAQLKTKMNSSARKQL